ncbi:MAG: phosphatidate cytidylyltransferase [Eubacteriales bacterium]
MAEKKSSLLIRSLVAIPLILLLVMALFFPNWFLRGLIYIISLISQYEIVRAANRRIPNMNHHLPFIIAAVVPPIFLFFGWKFVVLAYSIGVFWMMTEAIFNKKRDMNTLMLGIFTLIYPSVFFTAFFGISLFSNVQLRVLLILIAMVTAVATDTFAYFIGITWGKHKLISRISPKKSVEGAIAGYIGGYLVLILLGYVYRRVTGIDINMIHFVILGAVLPAMAQIGDLVASLVKRYFGIKDFGHLFPGHGGVLDRFDSASFISPLIYLYFTLVYGSLII